MKLLRLTLLTAVVASVLFATDSASAQHQHPRYFPLDHRIPGRATQWAQAIHPRHVEYLQPVKIELPSAGLISYFDGSPQNAILTQAPSQAGMYVGRTYRVRITGMPEFPGVELYPSIELLDRLHPPEGMKNEYPIPIQLTEEEIATALNDQLVTKVVYLEQPQIADPRPVDEPLKIVDLPGSANLLEAADRRGRAMAIVRIGGRTPNMHDPNDREFFGQSAPVVPTASIVNPQKQTAFGQLAAE